MKIMFAGQMAGGSRILRATIALRHEVVGVLIPRSERQRLGNMATIAESKGIPVLPGIRLKDPSFAEQLRDVDILLNVLSPFQVCEDVLAAPRIGSFNVHPSPLPKFAGLTPTSFAILHGASVHGVTLHWMMHQIDAGPIVSQQLYAITPADTPVTLLQKAFDLAAPMVTEFLNTAAADPAAIPKIDQDLSQREYFSAEDYPNTELCWEAPAPYLHALARACDYGLNFCPWGEVKATLGGIPVVVLKMDRTGEHPFATRFGAIEATDDGVRVAAAGEWLLVKKAKVDGKVLVSKDLSAFIASAAPSR